MSQENDILITVVIPTRHRDDMLRECLTRLTPEAQGVSADTYEIIVTDDGETAATRAFVNAEFPAVRWVQGPRKGPAANRNNGARAANGEWLIFCDDDCLPSSGLLNGYVDAIRINECADVVLEGRTIADRAQAHPLEGAPINERGGLLWSCNMAIPRESYWKIGGFNEQFPFASMEDLDFRKRVNQAQLPVRFVPEALVIHPWRMLDIRQHTKRHVDSELIYARLHPEDRGLFSVRTQLKCLVRYYVRDFPKECRAFGAAAWKCQPEKLRAFAYRLRKLVQI